MKLMFAARMARPDLIVAANHLSRFLTKWGKHHDEALSRLMGYSLHSSGARLRGSLRKDDLHGARLAFWLDADLASERERVGEHIAE